MKRLTIIAFVFSVLYMTNTRLYSQTENQEPNQPGYLKPIPPEELKADLTFLLKTIEEVHPNMHAYTTRAEFEPHRIASLRRLNLPMDPIKFFKTVVAPLLSALKNGHTCVEPPVETLNEAIAKGGTVCPFSVAWEGNHLILKQHYGKETLPIGGIISTVNEQDALTLASQFVSCFPSDGRPARFDVLNSEVIWWICSWLEFGCRDQWHIEVRRVADGEKSHTIFLL